MSKGSPDRNSVREFIVEIVSDSGEGAQKAGQIFGAVSAKMGNGVWTVEIIPAEIKPPARSPAGASGIRVRLGSEAITNMGDEANLVVAFNEQVLFGRITSGAYSPGTIILLENKWRNDPDTEIVSKYQTAVKDFTAQGFIVHELAMEEACMSVMPNPAVGKNMFVLGMLCHLFDRDLEKAAREIHAIFKHKGEDVIKLNEQLIQAGCEFAATQLDFSYQVTPIKNELPLIVTNGNQALGLGVMASGMELVSMYPITPATSASHYIASVFQSVGGFMHQAEDEIAAIGFAIGASYAGKTACTITSGPGLALKTEFIGLAVMTEIPLVICLVQRGGPSTGLPTKVEQSDLLATLFAATGDTPKIILAASTIEECFHFVITARKLAEEFRTPVVLLTDANLATGVQPYPRPEITAEGMAGPIDQSDWDPEIPAYNWDEKTGLSKRPIPGQAGGEYVLTGLSHTKQSKVAYDPASHQTGCEMRSRKLAVLQSTLKPPEVFGEKSGDLLIIGWGSTKGSIDEAVQCAQKEGLSVSAVHLRFLSPMEPGLKEIFSKFKQVITIEINYSDDMDHPYINEDSQRYAQLALLLRAHTLIDIDSWSHVYGQPIQPGKIYQEICHRLNANKGSQ